MSADEDLSGWALALWNSPDQTGGGPVVSDAMAEMRSRSFENAEGVEQRSPGYERSEHPGYELQGGPELRRSSTSIGPTRLVENSFGVPLFGLSAYPGYSLRSYPGLRCSNAFGVSE